MKIVKINELYQSPSFAVYDKGRVVVTRLSLENIYDFLRSETDMDVVQVINLMVKFSINEIKSVKPNINSRVFKRLLKSVLWSLWKNDIIRYRNLRGLNK